MIVKNKTRTMHKNTVTSPPAVGVPLSSSYKINIRVDVINTTHLTTVINV